MYDWKKYYSCAKNAYRKLKNLGENLYWDLYYTIGYSSMAGLGNGLGEFEKGSSFSEGFGEGYVNNFSLGIVVNLMYPLAFRRFRRSKHYRLYANLFTIGVNLGFFLWHYYSGTNNPAKTMVPNAMIGLIMANKHVSDTHLEDLV